MCSNRLNRPFIHTHKSLNMPTTLPLPSTSPDGLHDYSPSTYARHRPTESKRDTYDYPPYVRNLRNPQPDPNANANLESRMVNQPSDDPTDDTYPHIYEQSLDRLACAVGGKAVLPAAFQMIPGMLVRFCYFVSFS